MIIRYSDPAPVRPVKFVIMVWVSLLPRSAIILQRA